MTSTGFFNSTVETTIHLLPSRLQNLGESIRALISKMLMRYDRTLEGIVLAYDKLELLEQDAQIFLERPHLHFKIRFRVLLYRPQIGSYIVGTVNSVSDSDHIGLLVHGLFNAVLLAGKGLPSEYQFDQEQNAWVNSTTQEHISVGSKLRLKITRLDQSAGIISMQTSMLDDMTGIVQ